MGMNKPPDNVVQFPGAAAPEAPSSAPATTADSAPPPAAVGGEAENFENAVTPPDPAEAFTTKSGLEDYYFEETSRNFWLVNEQGEWVSLSEGGFRRHLKKRGLRDKPAPGAVISPVDEKISQVEKEHRVAFAGELAGYKMGLHRITGQRVLIPKSPEFIVPKKGEWPTLRKFFEGGFIGEEPSDREGGEPVKIDQLDRWFAWHQHLMQCYMDGIIAPGLALCVAGERDSGKSRLAMILRWCLGDRSSKPYDFMIGRDNFNRDMFSAVLQLVDDENADTRIDARLKFAAQIKKITANDEAKQRGMHKDGMNFSVLWRLMVLVNLEANRLMVLPPVDNDIADKLMMLKFYRRTPPTEPITQETPAEQACWPMPMPTRTEAEKAALRKVWQAELPAYLWWLLFEYKMPSHVAGGRFCVRHWQHPQILERLQQFSPHVRIWQLIEGSGVVFREYIDGGGDGPAEWKDRPEWKGTVTQLHALLVSDHSGLSGHDKKGIPDPSWLGQRLEACREHFGAEVCDQKRTGKARVWVLRKKEGLVE
jgi:hypothetical protein